MLLILLGFPYPFLLIAEQYLLAAIALSGMVCWVFTVKKFLCPRCPNFSCPLNRVPKYVVDAYLKRNPVMREAWEAHGYHLEERDVRT